MRRPETNIALIQLCILLIACFCLLSENGSLKAQEISEVKESAEYQFNGVQYVDQFPLDRKKQGNKKGFFNRIEELVFGKKNEFLVKPVSLVAESPDKYWAIDQYNSAIVLIEEQNSEFLKVKTEDEEAFTSMTALHHIPDSGLIFSDSRQNKVYFLKHDSEILLALGDSHLFEQPTGLAYSSKKDEIWVIETSAHRISIINSKGERQKTIGRRGFKKGEFNFPTHIWIDGKGYAYIVDALNFRIQIFDEEGEFVSMFGEQGDGSGYLARPKGIATDSYGNIYVVDALFHAVQIFDNKGRLLYYFGGQGKEKGKFWMPNGIYIDHMDNIFVCDTYNARIQVFNLVTQK